MGALRGSMLTWISLILLHTATVFASCPTQSNMTCTIKTRTSVDWFSSTGSHVYIYLYGDNGVSSGQLFLSGGGFGRGDVDTFHKTVPFMSSLQSITIGNDGSGGGSNWFLDWVEVECPDGGIDQHFGCGCWLDGNSRDLQSTNRRSCSSSRQRPSNGGVSCSHGTTSGSQCTYTCNEGYLLQGESCVYCLFSQQWSDREGTSTCTDCGDKICQYGTMDIATCTCQCEKMYSGDLCDIKSCPESEESYCPDWVQELTEQDGEDACTAYSNMKGDCPYTCKVCP